MQNFLFTTDGCGTTVSATGMPGVPSFKPNYMQVQQSSHQASAFAQGCKHPYSARIFQHLSFCVASGIFFQRFSLKDFKLMFFLPDEMTITMIRNSIIKSMVEDFQTGEPGFTLITYVAGTKIYFHMQSL